MTVCITIILDVSPIAITPTLSSQIITQGHDTEAPAHYLMNGEICISRSRKSIIDQHIVVHDVFSAEG